MPTLCGDRLKRLPFKRRGFTSARVYGNLRTPRFSAAVALAAWGEGGGLRAASRLRGLRVRPRRPAAPRRRRAPGSRPVGATSGSTSGELPGRAQIPPLVAEGSKTPKELGLGWDGPGVSPWGGRGDSLDPLVLTGRTVRGRGRCPVHAVISLPLGEGSHYLRMGGGGEGPMTSVTRSVTYWRAVAAPGGPFAAERQGNVREHPGQPKGLERGGEKLVFPPGPACASRNKEAARQVCRRLG